MMKEINEFLRENKPEVKDDPRLKMSKKASAGSR